MPEPLKQRLRTLIDPVGLEEGLDALETLDALGKVQGMASNFDQVREWYDERMMDRLIWVLEIVNDTDYARYLHSKAGYWVMNDTLALNITARHLQKLVNSDTPITEEAVEDALEDAATAVLSAYVRVVGAKDKAGREMGALRPKHKGQWADDTVTLATNFEATVIGDGKDTVADTSDYRSANRVSSGP